MEHEQKIAELHRLLDNLKLHLAYNHPTEVVNTLETIREKVEAFQEQVEE